MDDTYQRPLRCNSSPAFALSVWRSSGMDRDVVWANDIERTKLELYRLNFDASHFVLGDIRGLSWR